MKIAAWTIASIRPHAVTTSSTAAPNAAPSATSNVAPRATPPSASMSPTALATSVASMSATRTDAPARARATATPQPRPRPAPVTRAVRPDRSGVVSFTVDLLAGHAGIERVSQPVAHEVDGEHGDHDGQAGE